MEKNELTDLSGGVLEWLKTNKELMVFAALLTLVLGFAIWHTPRADPAPRGFHWEGCLVPDH